MFTATTPFMSKLVVADVAAKDSMTTTRRGVDCCSCI